MSVGYCTRVLGVNGDDSVFLLSGCLRKMLLGSGLNGVPNVYYYEDVDLSRYYCFFTRYSGGLETCDLSDYVDDTFFGCGIVRCGCAFDSYRDTINNSGISYVFNRFVSCLSHNLSLDFKFSLADDVSVWVIHLDGCDLKVYRFEEKGNPDNYFYLFDVPFGAGKVVKF